MQRQRKVSRSTTPSGHDHFTPFGLLVVAPSASHATHTCVKNIVVPDQLLAICSQHHDHECVDAVSSWMHAPYAGFIGTLSEFLDNVITHSHQFTRSTSQPAQNNNARRRADRNTIGVQL